jgi:hypothetical protein
MDCPAAGQGAVQEIAMIEELPVPDFDDERLLTVLRDYLDAAEELRRISPQNEPRRTLDLAEHKSLAGMALRRRLIDLGWTPPALRTAEL